MYNDGITWDDAAFAQIDAAVAAHNQENSRPPPKLLTDLVAGPRRCSDARASTRCCAI